MVRPVLRSRGKCVCNSKTTDFTNEGKGNSLFRRCQCKCCMEMNKHISNSGRFYALTPMQIIHGGSVFSLRVSTNN